MGTINDHWDEFNLWLEAQGGDVEPATNDEETWIGHPGEWSSGDVPEPPPNFVGEYWEIAPGTCGDESSPCLESADAILSATALELLEALEALYHLISEVANLDAFDNGVYAPDGRCEGNVLAGRVIEQARVAIVKARMRSA